MIRKFINEYYQIENRGKIWTNRTNDSERLNSFEFAVFPFVPFWNSYFYSVGKLPLKLNDSVHDNVNRKNVQRAF